MGCVVSVGKVCRGGGTEQQERVWEMMVVLGISFGLGFGFQGWTHTNLANQGQATLRRKYTRMAHGHENIE